jgi:hypothetical protein
MITEPDTIGQGGVHALGGVRMRRWWIFALVIALMMMLSGMVAACGCTDQNGNPAACQDGPDVHPGDHGPCMVVSECEGRF